MFWTHEIKACKTTLQQFECDVTLCLQGCFVRRRLSSIELSLSLALDLATMKHENSSKSVMDHWTLIISLASFVNFVSYFDTFWYLWSYFRSLFSGGNWRTLGPLIHSSGATCTWRSGFSWCSSLPALFLGKQTVKRSQNEVNFKARPARPARRLPAFVGDMWDESIVLSTFCLGTASRLQEKA